MLDTFTARIDLREIPGMTMERAVDRCRQLCNDLGRPVTLSAQCGKKFIQLGVYEPMPIEFIALKTAALHMGDIYACYVTPRLPKRRH